MNNQFEPVPGFDLPVARDGYAWWYVDALSDDGRHGLTVIAMIGSVFSPYYASARRRGDGHPRNHCALNVALYGAGGKRWALTERGSEALREQRDLLMLGPSALRWEGEALEVSFDEVTAPFPTRITGRIRLHPQVLNTRSYSLDASGRHRWWPIAPRARVEVTLEQPALRWSGHGYFDSNRGEEPLEEGFVGWDWSRATLRTETAVLYDLTRRDGERLPLALRFGSAGGVREFEPPPSVRLPRTRWRVDRATQSDRPQETRVVHTLEDTPFYARSVVSTHLLGESATAMHESLSLDRFRRRWVQSLLPVRMSRAR